MGFLGSSAVKNLSANAEDVVSIPGSEDSLQQEMANQLQYSCLGSPVGRGTWWATIHHQLPEFTQIHVHQLGDAIQPSQPLVIPFLFLPSIFPSVRVFSNESFLHIRWSKYWSFSFSIILPMNIQG